MRSRSYLSHQPGISPAALCVRAHFDPGLSSPAKASNKTGLHKQSQSNIFARRATLPDWLRAPYPKGQRTMYVTDAEITAYAKMIPADFSTGCAECDANQRSLVIAYIEKQLLDEGRIFRTGKTRPCERCGKPLPVAVADKYYNPRNNVH